MYGIFWGFTHICGLIVVMLRWLMIDIMKQNLFLYLSDWSDIIMKVMFELSELSSRF